MTDIFDPMREFVALTEKAEAALESGADWRTIFNFVFGPIQRAVVELDIPSLDYYDPDQDYEPDTKAYVQAMRERANDYVKIMTAVDNRSV